MNVLIILAAFLFFIENTTATVTPVQEVPDHEDSIQEKQFYGVIAPGTLWCGHGNKSKSKEDLGFFEKTDACCREHDMCPDSIPAGQDKHGLHNDGTFTRSHCDCDNAFRKCLKEAKNPISNGVGILYFTVLGPKCFKKTYPITGCSNNGCGRCTEYNYDKTAAEVWQWMDNPKFKKPI